MDLTPKKNLADLTYENHLKPKLQLITKKVTPNTKVFYRYERVKKMIDGFIVPKLKDSGINIAKKGIPSISKQGGGVNREALKKILTV